MKLRTLFEDLDMLYHGTWKSRVPDIMKYGLDPSKSKWAEGEEAPHHFVYLSSLEGAEAFSPGGIHYPETGPGSDPANRAILRIKLPPELQAKLITDRGEYIRAPFVIPPQFIEVIE